MEMNITCMCSNFSSYFSSVGDLQSLDVSAINVYTSDNLKTQPQVFGLTMRLSVVSFSFLAAIGFVVLVACLLVWYCNAWRLDLNDIRRVKPIGKQAGAVRKHRVLDDEVLRQTVRAHTVRQPVEGWDDDNSILDAIGTTTKRSRHLMGTRRIHPEPDPDGLQALTKTTMSGTMRPHATQRMGQTMRPHANQGMRETMTPGAMQVASQTMRMQQTVAPGSTQTLSGTMMGQTMAPGGTQALSQTSAPQAAQRMSQSLSHFMRPSTKTSGTHSDRAFTDNARQKELLDDSLPWFCHISTSLGRLRRALTMWHPLFGACTNTTDIETRRLRLIRLSTHVVVSAVIIVGALQHHKGSSIVSNNFTSNILICIVFFLQQIIVAAVDLMYNIFYPDPHPCTRYVGKHECLYGHSRLEDHRTTCVWDIYSMTCSYHEVELGLFRTLIVTVSRYHLAAFT